MRLTTLTLISLCFLFTASFVCSEQTVQGVESFAQSNDDHERPVPPIVALRDESIPVYTDIAPIDILDSHDADRVRVKDASYSNSTAVLMTMYSTLVYSHTPGACELPLPYDRKMFDIFTNETAILDWKVFGSAQIAYTLFADHINERFVLAFRGSNSSAQLIQEALASQFYTKIEGFDGNILGYFAKAIIELKDFQQSVADARRAYPTYTKLFLTGHSLGGALASLAAAALVKFKQWPASSIFHYSFGEPRQGDYPYAMFFDKQVPNSWRVVHNRDMVAHVPPCQHVPLFSCFQLPKYVYHHSIEVWYPKSLYQDDRMWGFKQCYKRESRDCSDGLTFKLSVQDHRHYWGTEIGRYCRNHGWPI